MKLKKIKMKLKNKIEKIFLLFIFLFFIFNFTHAQGVGMNDLPKKNIMPKQYTLNVPTQPNTIFSFPNTSNVFIKPFDKKNLPFFCRIEYDMVKQKNIPVKFRLGDVQYVDELEGKKH